MNEHKDASGGLLSRWRDYQPSKRATFMLMVATAIGVMYVGSGTGAWISNERAAEMARAEAQQARTELARTWCVHQFLEGPDASARLTELQNLASRHQRVRYIENGGWSRQPGESGSARNVASQCADVLMVRELQDADATGTTEAL